MALRLILPLLLLAAAPASVAAQETSGVTAGDPSEETVAEAIRLFRQGVALYRDGDFARAAYAFERAYETAPRWEVLYNWGVALHAGHRYAEALPILERYLEEGGDAIQAVRRRDVEATLASIRERIGYLEIAGNVDGADVFLDGERVGTTPLEAPVPVSLGHHRVELVQGGRSRVATVEVSPTEVRRVRIDLPEIVPDPPPAPVPEEGADPWPWVLGATAGAGGIAVVLFGALAVDAHSDLEALRGRVPGDRGAIDAAQSRTRAFTIATDVAIGVGVAALAGLVVLWLTGEDEETPDLVWGPTGVGVRL